MIPNNFLVSGNGASAGHSIQTKGPLSYHWFNVITWGLYDSVSQRHFPPADFHIW